MIVACKHVLCHALLSILLGLVILRKAWIDLSDWLVLILAYILSVVEQFSFLVLLLALCSIVGLIMLTNSHRSLLLCLNLLYVC